MSDLAESRLGRYRLLKLLGRGGMGEVHLAHDDMLDRHVAIKFVAIGKQSDPEARRRLVREAQAAASLDHPSICPVYEVGEAPDGRAYIVMQYVEGETLSARLAQGAMPAREALDICVHIADALAVAHRHGIIHRDLKSSNVMVTPSGLPKLLDFGIAKAVVLPVSAAEAPTLQNDTSDGIILGTPGSMSPEQVQQRPLDGRSDLFALGTLLYECLTGRRPFDARTTLEIIANVLHAQPPAPSSLRADVTEQHDALCLRLMAKEPADRFQSAEEVVGAARLLLSESLRGGTGGVRGPIAPPGTALPGMRGRVLLGAAVAAALVAALIYWWRVAPLPPPPEAAYIWYQRGTDAIRDGSYERGRRNLEQAIGLYPSYVLAHARLAEANAELDDQNSAAEDLVRVSALLPNEARLPDIERVRLEGVRRLVLRDVDRSIESFRRLVDLSPDDAGAWLDLGRAQEAAWVRADARHSYEQAIEKDPQYAAAYLRLGYLEALDARKDAALKAYAEAERLYQAASNLEGETEVLLKRGSMHDAFGDLAEARADLARANALASTSKIVYQQIRARIGLSSVTASEGKLAESEKMAAAAVGDAIAAGLNTVAAEGLTDLAATLAQLDRLQEAEADARRAIELAGQRAARYTGARARLQLAAVLQAAGRAGDALREVDAVLPFLKEKNYRRFELQGLQIASRAREQLDDLDRARTMSSEVLALAETIKDDGQVALAASNLASVNTALGHYPDALRLRDRAEAIHRRQGDEASLPFDLTNRADLLIRLNRIAEADAALSEVEAGAKKNLEPYKGRARRARFLRAFSAATQLRCGDAVPLASAINPADAPGDSSSVLAVAVMAFCGAPVRAGGQSAAAAPEPDVRPGLARERQYWLAAGSLRRNETARAFVEAQRGLTMLGATANDELRWRLSAVAAAAAQRNGDGTSSTRFFQDGRAALDRVRAAWKSDFATYETRTDLIELRKRAGL